MDNVYRQQLLNNAHAVVSGIVPHGGQPRFDQIRNDFIHHPRQFPLEFRRTREWKWSAQPQKTPRGDLGLCFESPKYFPTGTKMELSIPLRGDAQKFHGTVVMVREISAGYEIGLWLATAADASRARLVEEICHLECALRSGHRKIDRVQRKPKPRFATGYPQPLAN